MSEKKTEKTPAEKRLEEEFQRIQLQIADDHPDEAILLADGFEDALIGSCRISKFTIAIYDEQKCIDILVLRDGMSHEEAVEYFGFNVTGGYVGEHTPGFVTLDQTWEDLEEREEWEEQKHNPIADGFKKAFLGSCQIFSNTIAIYDEAKCVKILAKKAVLHLGALDVAQKTFEAEILAKNTGDNAPGFVRILRPTPPTVWPKKEKEKKE